MISSTSCKQTFVHPLQRVVYFSTPVDPEKSSSVNLLQCSLALGPVSSSNRAAQNSTQMPCFTRRSLAARLVPSDGLDWRVSGLLVLRYEAKKLTATTCRYLLRHRPCQWGRLDVQCSSMVCLEKFVCPLTRTHHCRRFYHSLRMSW